MNAADVLGYSFDGALYCVECARERFAGKKRKQYGCECERSELDEEGLCQENCTGYGPCVVFADQAEEDDRCDDCMESLVGG